MAPFDTILHDQQVTPSWDHSWFYLMTISFQQVGWLVPFFF
jgi:hypothetical protein